MTVITSDSLTEFVNIQLSKTNSCLLYASGVKFEGNFKDNQACGFGKFTWPNNEYFEGFYQNGLRNKIGYQKWCDGDMYKGEFYNDRRHGFGFYKWKNNDIYEGSFYNDSKHGFGTYSSSNNTRFMGTFYMNKREGFGTFIYENGNVFKGLYKDNYRCGPGILVYTDGRQDVGLWYRNSLLKLIFNMPEVFSIQQFPDLITLYLKNNYDSILKSQKNGEDYTDPQYPYDYMLQYKLKKPEILSVLSTGIEDDKPLKDTFDVSLLEENTFIDVKNFDDEEISQNSNTNPVENWIEMTIQELKNKEISDPHLDNSNKEYFKLDSSFSNFLTDLKIPSNLSSVMLKILYNLMRFSSHFPINTSEVENINITSVTRDILSNIFSTPNLENRINRKQKYGSSGDFESFAENLISFSHYGKVDEIKHLLMDSTFLNVNVTDSLGSFSLLEATLTWDTDLVNYLLDCGANINQITDEGISALGSCMLFYYPQTNFISTIAESVVKLNQTPYNYNGPRRDHIKNENSAETSENLRSKNLLGAGGAINDNLLNNTDKEEWNDYQNPVMHPDDINNELFIEISNDSQFYQPSKTSKISGNKTSDNNSNKFDSFRNNIKYPININKNLLEKAASVLSGNSMIINRQPRPNSCYQEISKDEGTARFKALKISRSNRILEVIQLLLRRGADPNISQVPFSAIFFAVKSGDIEMTKLLIRKGANPNASLNPENGSLTLLHISSCLPGKFGIMITEILLQSGAEPNARAMEDESFLDKSLIDEWSKDILSTEQMKLIGGKTPLHLACSRYDDFKISHGIVKLLLKYGANPNLLCNGHTALTLAIASGNDLIVDEILNNDKLTINLSLPNGLGNALCVASSTAFEHTRPIESRLQLIKKLISFNADLLALVYVGPKRIHGFAVDYAYHVFNLDQRVAHLPYHALTSVERVLFNDRRTMLSNMGVFTRENAVEKERKRLETIKLEGKEERSLSPDFIYTGAGAEVPSALSKSSKRLNSSDIQIQGAELLARKLLLKYCYECGRSVNVKLMPCTRCKEVYFCGKLCKTKAWAARHKSECLRVIVRQSSAESNNRSDRNADSPSPTTIGEDTNIAQGLTKSPNQEFIKRDPSQLKKMDMNNLQIDGAYKVNYTKRLPPLHYPGHPSYSYAYIMGQYVKVDSLGRLLQLEQPVLDNYSFE